MVPLSVAKRMSSTMKYLQYLPRASNNQRRLRSVSSFPGSQQKLGSLPFRTPLTQHSGIQYFTTKSTVLLDGDGIAPVKVIKKRIKKPRFGAKLKMKNHSKKAMTPEEKQLWLIRLDYNNRRAVYKRQVNKVRHTYLTAFRSQQAQDLKAAEELRARLARQHLEYMRRKNVRSGQRAMRGEAKRLEQAAKFQAHLDLMQVRREARKERFHVARQLVVDELEKEAPLWLTSVEEVKAAFSSKHVDQELWGRSHGVLGAPNPSLDCHFWGYETHTWHMDRSYEVQRAVLLRHLEEQVYEESNYDDEYWNETTDGSEEEGSVKMTRLQKEEEKERRAKLRAMVKTEGRKELMKIQRELMQSDDAKLDSDVPRFLKPPSLKVLTNAKALETEGAKVLVQDPARFFVFNEEDAKAYMGDHVRDASTDTEYRGPTLGTPIRLRDPLRDGNQWGVNTVYPEFVGNIPPKDARTEKEKKQDLREQKELIATAEAAEPDLDRVANDDDDQFIPDADPDRPAWDAKETEEWERDLDPETDAEVLATPKARRYQPEDIAWAINKLEHTSTQLSQQFAQDCEKIKLDARNAIRESHEKSVAAAGISTGDEENAPSSDGIETGSVEEALLNMNDAQMLALSDLDDVYHEGFPGDEFQEAVSKIGMSEEHLLTILKRDRTATE